MKEIGTYSPFLTPGTGCSAGRNANFMGPGEKEGKLLCSWLVCWDGRLLLLSSCMHCSLKSHRVKHAHSPWRALCQYWWCQLTHQGAQISSFGLLHRVSTCCFLWCQLWVFAINELDNILRCNSKDLSTFYRPWAQCFFCFNKRIIRTLQKDPPKFYLFIFRSS